MLLFDECQHPEDALARLTAREGIAAPYVGFLTAVDMENAVTVVETDESRRVLVLATVGIGNAERGEFRWDTRNAGTINILVVVDGALTRGALHECMAVAVEAKALEVYEAGVHTAAGERASGTSTDAIAVACTQRGDPERYAGTVTPVGYLVGKAVRSAVREGIAVVRR